MNYNDVALKIYDIEFNEFTIRSARPCLKTESCRHSWRNLACKPLILC